MQVARVKPITFLIIAILHKKYTRRKKRIYHQNTEDWILIRSRGQDISVYLNPAASVGCARGRCQGAPFAPPGCGMAPGRAGRAAVCGGCCALPPGDPAPSRPRSPADAGHKTGVLFADCAAAALPAASRELLFSGISVFKGRPDPARGVPLRQSRAVVLLIDGWQPGPAGLGLTPGLGPCRDLPSPGTCLGSVHLCGWR